MPSFIFNEKVKVNKIKDMLLDVFCLFVLLMTFFVFLPAQVYYNPLNVSQLDYYFYEYLAPVIILIIVAIVIFAGLLLFLPQRIRIIISVLMVSITFLLIFQCNILNWTYGWLDGRKILWKNHIWQVIVDTLLWVSVLLSVFIFRRAFYKKYLKNTVLFLFVFQLASVSYLSLSYHFSNKSKDNYLKEHYLDETSMFSFSKQDNVIIILLDTYRSDIFNEIINEDNFYRDIFKDFTYYRNNIGGYPSTYPSVPFLMTGEYYDNAIPIQEYIQKAFMSDSLPKIFLNRGYDVILPLYNEIFISPEISNNFRKKTLDREQIIRDFKKIRIRMAGGVGLNSLPTLLKLLFLVFIEKIHLVPTDDVFLDDFKNNFKTDNKRNTFKFFHLLGVHQPFAIDENLKRECMPYTRESLKKQSKADLKICKIIFEYMKKDAIFDNSLIVVMADHGNIDYEMINIMNGKKVVDPVIKSALPLLLVKKRQSEQKNIQINDQPTTNGDLREIIMGGLSSTFNDVRKYYFYYASVDNWISDYLPPMTEYKVTGHAWDEKSWQPTGKIYTKQDVDKKGFIYFNKDIVFNKKTVSEFLTMGWSNAEQDFTWTDGKEAVMTFLCDGIVKQDISMVSDVSPFLAPGKIDFQDVDVYADDIKIGSWRLKSGEQQFVNTIPSKCFKDGILKVKFRISHPASPAQYGMSNDQRMLGVAFRKIRFNITP